MGESNSKGWMSMSKRLLPLSVVFLGLCIILGSWFIYQSFITNQGDGESIEQQLLNVMHGTNITNIENAEIIHLEDIKNGMLVFYTLDRKLLNYGYIKLEAGKWKWIMGGGSLPLQHDDGINFGGYNSQEFFVRYGVITDNEIVQVRDEENDRNAKIIQSEDGARIYLFIHESIEAAGLENIVPIYAEQTELL